MATTMKVVVYSVPMLILAICTKAIGDEEFEGMSSLTLEHSFESGPDAVFSKRGTLVIQSLKGGAAHLTPVGPLSTAEKTKLKDLVKNEDIYRVRIPVKSPSGSMAYVSSFIKACQLYESGMSDILTLNTDMSGNVLGLSLTSTLSYCQGDSLDNEEEIESFNTTVEVVHTAQGPAPETQTYIQRIEHEKAEKAKGAQGDNRSFLAKYWMYLVPLLLFLMIVSNVDPNQAQGGGR